jgi:hypothetical protein
MGNSEGNAQRRLGETPGEYIPPAADGSGAGIDTREQRRQVRVQRRERARERRIQAWAMRVSGASYRQIATALGTTVKTAHADCQQELRDQRRMAAETNADRKAVMLAQLERAKLGLNAKVQAGDTKAADVLVKIIDRESKLLGTDAPARHAILARVDQHNTYDYDRPDDDAEVVSLMAPEHRAVYTQLRGREVHTLVAHKQLPPGDRIEVLAASYTSDELRAMVAHRKAKFRLAGYRNLRPQDVDAAKAQDAVYDARDRRRRMTDGWQLTVTPAGCIVTDANSSPLYRLVRVSGTGRWPPSAEHHGHDFVIDSDGIVTGLRFFEMVPDETGAVSYGLPGGGCVRCRTVAEHTLVVDNAQEPIVNVVTAEVLSDWDGES